MGYGIPLDSSYHERAFREGPLFGTKGHRRKQTVCCIRVRGDQAGSLPQGYRIPDTSGPQSLGEQLKEDMQGPRAREALRQGPCQGVHVGVSPLDA